jgi:thiosulfate dehydrogenase [quinone] large subunit
MRIKSHLTGSLFSEEEQIISTASKQVVVTRKGGQVQDPPLVMRLLTDPRAGWLWVLPRIWLGYQWFAAGQHKVGDPGWVQTGAALKGYWASAVAYGELTIGIALMIGAFTGIAAFFGGLMNWNYMMAGSASTNPLLFVIAIALILAWKVSGYIGADFFLLRWIGTPWRTVPIKADEPTVSRP